MHRRDLIIGGACLLGAAAAVAAKPRRHVALLKGGSLADMVPPTFGGWVSEDVGDPLAINAPDSLTARLYSQLVTRVYTNEAMGFQVMMLLAYGSDQTDDLQLHRPEVCYPAFGYALQTNDEIKLPVTGGVLLPARRLIAQSDERREGIIYWTRMGELLPASGREQREDRVRIAMQGIVPDLASCRSSTIWSEAIRADSWRAICAKFPCRLLLTAVVAPEEPSRADRDRTRQPDEQVPPAAPAICVRSAERLAGPSVERVVVLVLLRERPAKAASWHRHAVMPDCDLPSIPSPLGRSPYRRSSSCRLDGVLVDSPYRARAA